MLNFGPPDQVEQMLARSMRVVEQELTVMVEETGGDPRLSDRFSRILPIPYGGKKQRENMAWFCLGYSLKREDGSFFCYASPEQKNQAGSAQLMAG